MMRTVLKETCEKYKPLGIYSLTTTYQILLDAK
jgi:hypothetical protein